MGVVIASPDGESVMTKNYDADVVPINDGTTDKDMRASSNNLFTSVERSHRISIHADGVVKVKFNGTNEDQITVTPNKRFDEDNLLVHDVYVTNTSGVTVNVEFYLRGPSK